MSDLVRITDVAPRDGLQNEPGVIPTDDKVRLIRLLTHTGVDEIEISSFVSPKWIPQLGDAAEVFAQLADRDQPLPVFCALVPNEEGMHAALAVNKQAGHRLIDKIAVFTSASETFSRKNTNASIDETFERFGPVISLARDHGLAVRGYVSCVVKCPFEEEISPAKVAEIAARLLGDDPLTCVDEIDLGDTIGAGIPETIGRMIEAVLDVVGQERIGDITLHLHDTFGHAPDCVREALDLGIRSFDGSVAGIGGCPYASTPDQRAPGNISTESLVVTINDAGFRTNVDLEQLGRAASFAQHVLANARSNESTGPTP